MERKLIKPEAVRELCGGISEMSLWRWIRDPKVAFPQPVYIATRRYFKEAEVFAWLDAQSGEAA